MSNMRLYFVAGANYDAFSTSLIEASPATLDI